jgi:hypothetical protein
MTRLDLRLLGGFQARLGGAPSLALPAKAQALLAYLGLRPNSAHPRDKVAALLWGATSDAQARANLRHTVFVLRKALGESVLQTDGHTLAVDPRVVNIDTGTFERLVGKGTPEALERAGGLYEGDLLDGLVADARRSPLGRRDECPAPALPEPPDSVLARRAGGDGARRGRCRQSCAMPRPAGARPRGTLCPPRAATALARGHHRPRADAGAGWK